MDVCTPKFKNRSIFLSKIIVHVAFRTKRFFIISSMERLTYYFRIWGLIPLIFTFCTPSQESRLLPKESLDKLALELTPEFELHPDFQWELYAAEPLIRDPVAMEIDERGRIFVVEMPGYPLDVSGSGRIIQLIDENSDGFPDRSQIFAENLVLPTGIMRWKEGFLVTDAPDVLYLEDTDGDGQADLRKVVLNGFARSNPQHNVNTPMYGLDNGIYLANEYFITTQQHASLFGDKGTEIYFPDRPNGPRLPSNANDRNVRFRPDTYELQMASSQSQYGHTFDPWGRYFQTSNASHLHHEVIAAKYLQRKPYLRIAEAQQYVPTYGHPIEVFPITQNPEYQLLTDVGTMTSACGITWYKGDLFPQEFQQVIFTAEPSHNLIHVDQVETMGATYSSTSPFVEKEFLRSQDPWFRPVFLYQGPDGALYVLDYHRKIVEHPEWMAESVNSSGELYEGSQKGRIFRISPKGVDSLTRFPDLRTYAPRQLVECLDHKNSWWRLTAQRILVDRKDSNELASLGQFLSENPSPLGELHGLWTLQGLGKMKFSLLRDAVRSPHPGLRENALRLMEYYPDSLEAALPELSQLGNDPDPRVRFQWMCTMGETSFERDKLIEKLFENVEDSWFVQALFTTPDLQEERLFSYALKEIGSTAKPIHKEFFRSLGAVWAMKEGPMELEEVIGQSLARGYAHWKAPFLEGIYQAFLHQEKRETFAPELYDKLLQAVLSPSEDIRNIGLKFIEFWELPSDLELTAHLYKAESIIGDRNQNEELRADAISLLSLLLPERYDETFYAHLASSVPAPMQKAALEGLGRLAGDRGCRYILQQWKTLSPEIRSLAVDEFVKDSRRSALFLKAIQDEVVDASVLGWPRTVRLMNHRDLSLKQYAREVLAPAEELPDELQERYQAALGEGNPQLGYKVYVQQCQVCHTYKGKGNIAYGPDLATVRNRESRSLLLDILNPNRSIADGYEIWDCTLQNGRALSGIICKETAQTFTLRSADGREEVLLREEVKELTALSHSGMPTGLSAQITPSSMADLIAFVKFGNPEEQ